MILVLLSLGILAVIAVVATSISVIRDGYGSRPQVLPPLKEWDDGIR